MTIGPEWVVPIVVAIIGLLGIFITYVGTSGKNKGDALSAREARLDAKFTAYTDSIEEDRDALKAELVAVRTSLSETKAEVRDLKKSQSVTLRREVLMYQYMQDLRNHILNKLPPPPPAPHPELVEWFEDIEATDPRAKR